MKYKIAKSFSFYMLEEEVNRLMQDGWTPIGGLSIESSLSPCYYQAMSQEEPVVRVYDAKGEECK